MFDDKEFKPTESSLKRLNLAGGDVSLDVRGQGRIRLMVGDGSVFELKNCLWMPKLSRKLIAGGLLKAKRVHELYDESVPTNFSLVRNDLALLNGYIGLAGNLMHLEIEPVSPFNSKHHGQVANVTASLLCRQLGRLGDFYLKNMRDHGSLDGECEMELSNGGCKICFLSKEQNCILTTIELDPFCS